MPVGLDCGTCFLVSARQGEDGQVNTSSVRDAFLEIEGADASVINMLKMSNVSYVQGDRGSLYIVGEAAVSLSNLMKLEARRPLSRGILSPGELEAEKMLIILIKSVLKEPTVENETVFYSIPAKPIDRDVDILFHEAILKKILEALQYKAVSMNEGAAVVFADAEKDNFTAIATSCGSGMCNTALVYQTMVGAAFSISIGGDYIDSSAAKATGSTATRIMSIKERGVYLLNPAAGDPKTLREREAIVVYYKNLIHQVIDGVKREFRKGSSKIELPESLPWILSGGSSLAKNFLEFFKVEFEKDRFSFPLNISEIRMAKSPLNAVAQGLLIAAMNE
jgi:hypothetical protein